MMKRIFTAALFALLLPAVPGAAQTPYCSKITPLPDLEISLYTPAMFRVRSSALPGEKFPPKYEIPFLMGHLDPWAPVGHRSWQEGRIFFVETDSLRLRIDLNTRLWTVLNRPGTKQIYPSTGQVFGMFKDGYTVFDNASAFDEENRNSRYAHWFYNPETGRYTDTYLAGDLIFDKYFIYGPRYERLLFQINQLVGPEPLLPRKAFGFLQTQHLTCTGTQEKLFEIAHTFRKKDIPCDVLILDYEWGDACIGNREIDWGGSLEWSENYTRPLSPRQMLDSLHRMHFDVMLIHHNAPNFANRHAQGWTQNVFDEKIWWAKVREQFDEGVDGIWQDTRRNDLTDGVLYDEIQRHFGDDDRVLFMACRKMMAYNPWDSGFYVVPSNDLLASRRYPFNWTEDCSYSFNEMAFQLKAIANTHGALKGLNYLTSDVVAATWQIQARWNQFACLSPIVRSHNPKPWDGDTDVTGFLDKIRVTGRDTAAAAMRPETATPAFGKPTAENSIRKHLKLRYRLLPYIYSYAFENYLTGMPMCRPMLMAFPKDYRCYADQWPHQYMFGNELLVAPVTADLRSMEIYLPEKHRWVDFHTKTVYEGANILRYNTEDVETLPVFVRGGAIIPLGKDRNWLIPGEQDDSLTLEIYALEPAVFTLSEDDGKSLAYQKGAFAQTLIKAETDAAGAVSVEISPATGTYRGQLKERQYLLKVFTPGKAFVAVQANGQAVLPGKNGWYYSPEEKMTYVWVRSNTREHLRVLLK